MMLIMLFFSTGEGADRKITVRKPKEGESLVPALPTPKAKAAVVGSNPEAAAAEEEEEDSSEVEKPCGDVPVNPFDLLQLEADEEEEEEEEAPAPSAPEGAMYTCGACKKDIPACNQALHDAHCWRQTREKRIEEEEKEAKKARKKEKNEAKLLESYKNDCCWKKGCNQKLSLMSMVRAMFCFKSLMDCQISCSSNIVCADVLLLQPEVLHGSSVA